MLSVVVTWTKTRRTARAAAALLMAGLLLLLAAYPAFASEPKPPGYRVPRWVTACLVLAAIAFVVGGTLHRMAAQWRRERLHLLAALDVRVLPGDSTAPGTWSVRVTDAGTGASATSSTERTVPANEQRALDLLLQQLAR